MSEKKEEKKELKPFNEMMDLDLSNYVQKKPTFFKKDGKLHKTNPDKWLDYIEWAMVLILLYKNGAEQVLFWSKLSEEKPNTLDIHILIDGNEYTTQYPIINGNAVINSPNQLDLHKSELRGFVKCVAIHTGLGLKLWLNEEKALEETTENKKEAKKEQKKSKFKDYNAALNAVLEGKKTAQWMFDKYECTPEQEKQLKEAEKSFKNNK